MQGDTTIFILRPELIRVAIIFIVASLAMGVVVSAYEAKIRRRHHADLKKIRERRKIKKSQTTLRS